MRQRWPLVVALLACAAAMRAGVRVVARDAPAMSAPVDLAQSAALFVGVREFPEDRTLTRVEYAVDDAVDLAYLLAIDKPLVSPERVVLALSGEPQKPESKERCARLVAAGAKIEHAGYTDILRKLREQARAVGEDGLLIVSFATHGINDGGTQRLLTETSLLQDPEISVSEAKVRDILSDAGVPRALILIDACREQLTSDVRTASSRIYGQVVFSAAAAGQYAYDDDARRNGVFTSAVMDGLRCLAPADANGYITVYSLSRYVEERVVAWIRKNRDPGAKRATQLSVEGSSATMPLSFCPLSGKARAPRPAPR